MSTFAEDIESATQGEPIIAVTFPESYVNTEGTRSPSPIIPANLLGKRLPWSQVRNLLDYSYDSSYGSQECNDVFVWTKNLVLTVHEYDGSTSMVSFPRNPPAKRKGKA